MVFLNKIYFALMTHGVKLKQLPPLAQSKCIFLTNLSLTQFIAFLNCIYLNDTHMEEHDSVQELIEIEGWLLLTFFMCLHNHLSSFNSIIVQETEKT